MIHLPRLGVSIKSSLSISDMQYRAGTSLLNNDLLDYDFHILPLRPIRWPNVWLGLRFMWLYFCMTRFLPQSNFDSSVTIQSFNKYINMHLSGRQLHVLTSSISVLTLETTQDLVSMNHQCVSSIPCLAPGNSYHDVTKSKPFLGHYMFTWSCQWLALILEFKECHHCKKPKVYLHYSHR